MATMYPVSQLHPSPTNPRIRDAAADAELLASHEVVLGARRLEAARAAELGEVPAELRSAQRREAADAQEARSALPATYAQHAEECGRLVERRAAELARAVSPGAVAECTARLSWDELAAEHLALTGEPPPGGSGDRCVHGARAGSSSPTR